MNNVYTNLNTDKIIDEIMDWVSQYNVDTQIAINRAMDALDTVAIAGDALDKTYAIGDLLMAAFIIAESESADPRECLIKSWGTARNDPAYFGAEDR